MEIAVVFGGKSCEHDISVITGIQVLGAISGHNAYPIYIDGKGAWWSGKGLDSPEFYRKRKTKTDNRGLKRVYMRPPCPFLVGASGKTVLKPDVYILCGHGMNGEDGSVQGLMQLCGAAYTGSDVRASAVGMDKVTMKKLFAVHNIVQTEYVDFSAREYMYDLYAVMRRIKETLTFPMIVKPSNLGSSIGIGKARDYTELFAAVRVALMYDERVIAERALENFDELNCAVIRSGERLISSEVEKPIGWTDILSFEDKYMSKSLGDSREFPAKIDAELREKVRTEAQRAYRAIGADGVARVDFMLCEGQLYINEINTIPGAMSMYLFDCEGGIRPHKMIEMLIDSALERRERLERLKYTYLAPSALRVCK